MKVAVCFSGHTRTFEKTSQSIRQHLLDKYDCDVFMHTWDVKGTTRKEDVGGLTSIDVASLNALCKIKTLMIEPQIQFDLENHDCFLYARTPPHNVKSKWYSAKKSFELSQQSEVKYDVIVSVRPDMLFHENVILSSREKVLFLPGNVKTPNGTLHDYFAFGDVSVMKSYFELYDQFDHLCENVAQFRPETIFTYHVLNKQIDISFCQIEYSLVRLSGEIRRC